MSSISIYFQSISSDLFDDLHQETIGQSVHIHVDNSFPDWSACDVVFFGVQEDRASESNMGAAEGPTEIRRELYRLYKHFDLEIADLGNIYQGASIQDTYKAVEDVVFEIIKKNKTVVFLGGSRDLGFCRIQSLQQIRTDCQCLCCRLKIKYGRLLI